MLIPIDRARPLGDQLYVFLREAILAGRLAPGARVPSSRRLAQDHRIARNTVVAAYERLRAEGYLEADGARGTRVSRTLTRGVATGAGASPRRPTPRRRGSRRLRAPLSAHARRLLANPDTFPPAARRSTVLPWDFQYNVNVSDAASRRAWHRLLRRAAARHEHGPVPYDLSGKAVPLQGAIASYLVRTRGVHCTPEQVILVNDFQQTFQLAARLLTEPGDTVALEDPQRLGARHAFLAHGLRVRPVRTDGEGLRPADLPATGDIRMLYLSPSHLWPSGSVLPLPRRLQVLEWAREQGAWILENDHNSEYTWTGTPEVSLQGLDDTDSVLYAGTFSRLISPEPEVAYVVVPPSLIPVFRAARTLEAYHVPSVEAEALAAFLDGGQLEALVRRVVRRILPLRDALHGALEALGARGMAISPGRGGLQLHVTLRGCSAARAEALVRRCAERGIGVFPDAPYHLRPPRPAGLIFGFAALTPERIREGVRRFGRVLEEFRGDAW